jgi:DNA adenine methylase
VTTPAGKALKPPFTYFGGKTAIAGRIVALLPPHEHYVEPFAGSLAVLLAKPPSRMETVNDADGDLMNFWRMLRDRTDDLLRVAALTPHSRGEHLSSFAPADDDLERARRVWVRLTQGRGGHTSRRTGWRYYQDPRGSHSSMPEYVDAYLERICPAARRLRGVSLECKPAVDLIRDYGRHPETLVYADPPYLGSLRTWGNNYAVELRSDEEHTELLEVLLGCRSAVVLSGYASDLYDGLLSTWSRREIATQTGNGGTDRARTEVLWSNRPFPQGSLFDLAAMEDAS